MSLRSYKKGKNLHAYYLFFLATASSSVETSSFVKTFGGRDGGQGFNLRITDNRSGTNRKLIAFAEVITDDDFQELVAKMAQTDEDHTTMTAHILNRTR